MITDGLNPLTLLLFVGAVLGGGALLATYVFARVTGRQPLAKAVLFLGAGGVGVYLLLFLGPSVASRDRVLAVGEEKHMCEVDCYLALSPNRRYVALVDAQGRRYPGSPDGLRRRLLPGESYTTDLAFDLPIGAQGVHLILRSDDFETPFLIGHENRWFHGKTTFALGT